jgi:hypothetical protein
MGHTAWWRRQCYFTNNTAEGGTVVHVWDTQHGGEDHVILPTILQREALLFMYNR